MRAIVGDDSLWKPMRGFFTPGTPLYNEQGGEILKGQRNFDAAKRMLAESGYSGQPVTCMAAQDYYFTKAWGEVTADLLKRLGINVDYAALDYGTVVARRAQKTVPSQGGWHLFLNSHAGVDCASPATNKYIRANGDDAWFGWPSNSQIEADVAAWFEVKTLEEEKTIAHRLNKTALDFVVYAPLGLFLQHQAWRQERHRHRQGPAAVFLGREQDRLTNAGKAVTGAGAADLLSARESVASPQRRRRPAVAAAGFCGAPVAAGHEARRRELTQRRKTASLLRAMRR
jgi:peptide/nickel transport system substrate-binding protein